MFEIETSDFLQSFEELKKKNDQKRPYNINLIDELHADENAHSRILVKLLSFAANNRFPIFEEFVAMLNEKLDDGAKIGKFSAPIFSNQFEYIDAYIYEEKTQSIIIENKIDWATDQEKQLERYIDSAKKTGISENKIFVVYLTDNGRKKAADYSLTEKAKNTLGMTAESKGRYIELNYHDDILPFLKEILAYLDFSKEIYLKSAVVQYIDYLEGRFGMREREKAYFDSMTKGLQSILNIQDSEIQTIAQREAVSERIIDFCGKIEDERKSSEIAPYMNALRNEIFPEKMQPRAVARYVLFHFANKEKQIIVENMPFSKAQIIWQNPKLHNIVIFIMKNGSALNVAFTANEIQFLIRTEYAKKEVLRDFFGNYKELPFTKADEYKFTLPYEEHYQNIIPELENLFSSLSTVVKDEK